MLTVEEALARCLEASLPVRPERVGLALARGRVLAEDVASTDPVPRWDNSAMDGYAVRAEDTSEGVVLAVLETIAAGSVGSREVTAGTAARIMTGAPLPSGADAVVMREDTDEHGDTVRIRKTARPGQHVRRRGEEIRAGDVVLQMGATLTPAALGLCATLGRAEVTVARRPRVAIVSTGDEVVPLGRPLLPGQIWSSNSTALAALVEEAGGEPLDCGNAPDTLEGTRAAFRRASEGDIVLSTGGVSVGDFDVVKEALAEEGAEMKFWKVSMKPGKPLAFGVVGTRPAFGLPGNPVSCVVNFLQFVRPVIRRSLGDPRPYLPVVDAVLRGSVRKRPGRAELVRVALHWGPEGLEARPARGQDSSMITGLASSHGFLLLGTESEGAAEGDRVPVQVFEPGFLSSASPGYRWAP